MNKAEFEKILGKKVKITLFDGTELQGTLQKTGAEHLKSNLNLFLPKGRYFVATDKKATEAVKHIIFRFSHIKKLIIEEDCI